MIRSLPLLLLWAPTSSSWATGGVGVQNLRLRVRAPISCSGAVPQSEDLTFSAVELESRFSQFASTEELPTLRSKLSNLQSQLENAIESQDFASAAMLRDDVAELRQRDPANVAVTLRQELEAAIRDERYGQAARCRDELLVLRRFLPQYQLAGLWKGNYPNHGEELVRIHYEGDMLYATKVTGDEHVPAGEVTFRADLASPFDEEEVKARGGEDMLGVRVEVVSVSTDGDHQQRDVEQYNGAGRIAAKGFQHAHYVPGQLFLMDVDVVGFLWLPLGTFVVFSREPEEEVEVCSAAAAAQAAKAYGEPLPGAMVGNSDFGEMEM